MRAHACCPAGTTTGPALPAPAQSPQPKKIRESPGTPRTSTSTEVSTAGSGESLVTSMPTVSVPPCDSQQDTPPQCTRPPSAGGAGEEVAGTVAVVGRSPPAE